jgi:uncharacterized DUF497 family protein
MSDDAGYIWNQIKYKQVQQKHQIRFHEVVSAFEDPEAIEEPDPQGSLERHMLVACSFNHRILQIIYEDNYTEDGSLIFRIITAFDAGQEWQDVYRQRL